MSIDFLHVSNACAKDDREGTDGCGAVRDLFSTEDVNSRCYHFIFYMDLTFPISIRHKLSLN